MSPAPAPPLSIAFYTYASQPRGSVVHTASLADALHDAGHDVHVYALDKGTGFYRPLRARLHLIPAGAAPPDVSALVDQRRREFVDYLLPLSARHDIHHAQDCLAASALLDLRALRQVVPIVRTVHHIETFADPYLAECQARSILDADACLSVSEATRAELRTAFGVESFRVRNGVEIERFAAVSAERMRALRERLSIPAGAVLLSVGGVEERKNSLACLAAFDGLRREQPEVDWQWVIAGGASILDHAPYRARFEEALAGRSAAVRGAVHRLGVINEEDMAPLYGMADVFCLPSLHEGWGLTVLEAMAARVPVVTSRRPPFTEYLDDSCAVLVDPDRPAAIAAGVTAALRESRAGRVQRARERAAAFGWRGSAEGHVEVYRRLLVGAGTTV